MGFGVEILSRGAYAELLADNRPFTAQEEKYFEQSAHFAYASFRDKAAESRGLEIETMQESAQGRVWSGHRAIGRQCAASHLSRHLQPEPVHLIDPDWHLSGGGA